MTEVTTSLYNGDCLEVLKEITEKSVNLVISDPPYQVTACKWDTIIPFEPLWEELKRVATNNAAFVFTAKQPFTTDLINSNRKDFKYCWVWDKVSPAGFHLSGSRPMQRHEDIVIFARGKNIYNKQGRALKKPFKASSKNNDKSSSSPLAHADGKDRIYTHKSPVSILVFSRHERYPHFHPTQKPVALMRYLIQTYSNEGDTVLDFCMGSGSAGIASKQLNRYFIGIEKDVSYFSRAKESIDITKNLLRRRKLN